MKCKSAMSTLSRINQVIELPVRIILMFQRFPQNRVKMQSNFINKYNCQLSDQWNKEFFKLHSRWKQKSVHTMTGEI